jgi:hypothetical protein
MNKTAILISALDLSTGLRDMLDPERGNSAAPWHGRSSSAIDARLTTSGITSCEAWAIRRVNSSPEHPWYVGIGDWYQECCYWPVWPVASVARSTAVVNRLEVNPTATSVAVRRQREG